MTTAAQQSAAVMLTDAEALEGTPYVSGGGHGGFDPIAELKKLGLDCSGFVSEELHVGGYLNTPETTEGLPSQLAKGPGKYVTVLDRADGSQAHTLIEIDGHVFEEGGNPAANPSGAVAELTPAEAKTELSGGGFVDYHPTGTPGASSSGGFLGIGDNVATAYNDATHPGRTVDQFIAGQEQSALSWVESNAERGVLYFALIIGGVVLAGFGLVKMLAPTGMGGVSLGRGKAAEEEVVAA